MNEDMLLVLLPEREQMMSALTDVNDETRLVRNLYPRVCAKLAGQMMIPSGICVGFSLAIYESGMSDSIVSVINTLVPEFIVVITPDGIARKQALADWEEIMRRVRGQ